VTTSRSEGSSKLTEIRPAARAPRAATQPPIPQLLLRNRVVSLPTPQVRHLNYSKDMRATLSGRIFSIG
jgi:hypothetical protein